MTTLNGQVVGRAHYAARAVLERELAGMGITFQQQLALNVIAGGGDVVAQLTGSLKIDEAAVLDTIAELVGAGLVTEEPLLQLTDAGLQARSRIGEVVAGIAARLYDGIPDADLAVAGRVLTLLTQRANAELTSRTR